LRGEKLEFGKERRIVLAIALAALVIGVATAAVTILKQMPSTVNVVSSPGLTVLDPSCSTVLTTLLYPALPASSGATSSLTVCLMNAGNAAFYLVKGTSNSVTFAGLPAGLSGDWNASGLPVLLNPGQTHTVTITLTNDGSASAGSQSFTTIFTGYDQATG